MRRWIAKLRRLALASGVAGTLALLGAVLFPTIVSACIPGTPDCPYPPPPVVVVGPNLSPLSLVAPVAVLVVLIIVIEIRWRAWARAERQRRERNGGK